MINDAPIRTDYFVEGFIDHTISGMIEALEGTGKIKDLNLTVEGDKVTVNLNGAVVPTNAFTSKIIKSTIIGMVSTLKGVADIKKLSIVVHK
jgi:sulfur carrier protein ThiS